MSELYFRIGEMKGFTAIDLADKKEGYANPIRELLQNSMDASNEAGNDKCEVNIFIETIKKSQIPHIDEYQKVLQQAVQTSKKQSSYNANSEQRVKEMQSALQEKNLKVLMFSDNGTGMRENQLDAILTGGVSIKGDEKSGGSFGVGNLSSYSLSSLRYVLYATKCRGENNETKKLFTGSPILAGHRDGEVQRGNRGRIVTKKPDNELGPHFVYPEAFPDFIEPKMNNLDRGTVVVILGLSEDWDEDAEYAVVSNFFHAIAHDRLSVNIHQEGKPQKIISYNEVERLIAEKKDNQRKTRESILSGKAVYQAWQTVTEENTQKTIKLSNADKVYVCIKSANNTDSVVILVRNGMVIARHDSMLSTDIEKLRKDKNYEPFTAVIDVDKIDAPKLFEFVKGAESPYHNRLQTKMLDNEDEKSLKKLLKELSEKIKEQHLKIIERDSFHLPLFSVPDKAEAQAGGGNRSSGQNDKAKPQSRRKKPPKQRESKEGEGKKRPKPIVISRKLESKIAARYMDKGDKWKVLLRVAPKNQENIKDEVYLSICVGEDNDNEEASKIYLDFEACEINEQTIKIPDFVDVEKNGKLIQEPFNKNQVKLGRLEQTKQYNIIAEVRKPDGIGNTKVALLPLFGLKQKR